ncbi:hypothetical protein AYL99_10458 [Fonsecaea erecta]|uniref:Heterokaryon incompatibility domain-containing protein n=1 Tax=Fonsecaea erecta TaxID=1367422 RepID=A0A178Z8X9_9EURO|nr:hypothetical protein AYL99_10458 [Fonsecaea erecta]OAP55485.1 hypothetical protein AYL99_10458 [Fonsecaea erecta]
MQKLFYARRRAAAGTAKAINNGDRRESRVSEAEANSDASAKEELPQCDLNCWVKEAMRTPLTVDTKTPTYLSDDARISISTENAKAYQTLTSWQTRLIVLHPGDADSPITCDLIVVNLIDGPGLGIDGTNDTVLYDALSYSWGHPALVCEIICNNQKFGVPKELGHALTYLRDESTSRYIWCDAICVNQQSLAEKSRQVQNMLRIFEKAHKVVAWIGLPAPESGRTFAVLRLMSDSADRNSTSNHSESCQVDLKTIATDVSAHLARAWFTRTWVRQEVFAAKRLFIQAGSNQLDFETFVGGAQLLLQRVPDTTNRWPATLSAYQNEYQHFGSDRGNFQSSNTGRDFVGHWFDVLEKGLLFQVTEPQDRIYGALGLLTSRSIKFFVQVPEELEMQIARFPIDYSKSINQVHQDVVKFLINTTKTLAVLDVFRLRSPKPLSNDQTAAWAIDFRKMETRYRVSNSIEMARGDLVLQQNYAKCNKLYLRGLQVAKQIVGIDAKKDISHPKDRSKPIYGRSVSLNEVRRGSQRRGTLGLSVSIENPPYAFVFSNVQSSATTFELRHTLVRPEEMSREFAEYLASDHFVFAYVEDYTDEESNLEIAPLHLLVPRSTTVDDRVVSFQGSRCLHLIRPTGKSALEHIYLGPIAAVVIGQDQIRAYAMKNEFSVKSVPKASDTELSRSQVVYELG